MSEAAIAITAVTKGYAGHMAVNELCLAVPRGSVFGLLGPNGAGKTTTLRMVMNVLGPDSGTIEILGRPADGSARDRIGYMPEERGLYPRMVLEDQLVFFAEMKGTPRAEARRRIPAWLERLGLEDKWRRRRVNELSKGMQQKAQFIATVLHDPEILILDEPMSGLDPVAARRDARACSSSCAGRARRWCSRATRWRRSSGCATESRCSTAARSSSTARSAR